MFITSKASAFDGHVELGKYVFGTNYPSYIDNQGPPLKYRLDVQIDFRPLPKRLTVSVGIDAAAATVFTQAAGRLGVITHVGDFDIGLYHRSPHSFDHQNVIPSGVGFFQANWLGIRYNFGEGGT